MLTLFYCDQKLTRIQREALVYQISLLCLLYLSIDYIQCDWTEAISKMREMKRSAWVGLTNGLQSTTVDSDMDSGSEFLMKKSAGVGLANGGVIVLH